MNNPYPWLQDLIDQVPDIVQPVIVALAAAIPYVEGEGAAALAILAGINPIVAGLAAALGNILAVIVVVLLGARARGAIVTRRARTRTDGIPSSTVTSASEVAGARAATDTSPVATMERSTAPDLDEKPTRRSKGRAKLRLWLVRFGVPGASILAPIALPTMLTAAFFVASGVRKEWVILWQIVAIVLWTGAVAAAAAGVLALLGW